MAKDAIHNLDSPVKEDALLWNLTSHSQAPFPTPITLLFSRWQRIQGVVTTWSATKPAARVLLSSCAGLALALAYSSSKWSWFALIALIPMLVALRSVINAKAVLGYSWLLGVCFCAGTLYWIAITYHRYAEKPYFDSIGRVLLLSSFEAVFVAASVTSAICIARRSRVSVVASLPIAWVAGEWLRSCFPIGFPWGLLGNSLSRDLRVIQIAEFTGVYGISALIVFVNAALFSIVFEPLSRAARLRRSTILAVLLSIVFGFGAVRLSQLEAANPEGMVKVGIAQGGLPQTFHFQRDSIPSNFRVYEAVTKSLSLLHPAVIIWPENAIGFVFQPDGIYPASLDIEKEFRDRVLRLAAESRTPLLFGAPALYFSDEISMRNRAYLISAQGEVLDHDDNIKLVPFSEYLPARSLLGRFMETLVKRPVPYSAGDLQQIFDVGGTRLGVIICYESIFPYLSQRLVKGGANVLVNISNDTWSGASSAPYEFLSADVMRAVENHAPLVRVANSGISAVIAPTGRIFGATQLFRRTAEVEQVRWSGSETFYTQYGDIFSEACCALTILGLVWLALQMIWSTSEKRLEGAGDR